MIDFNLQLYFIDQQCNNLYKLTLKILQNMPDASYIIKH